MSATKFRFTEQAIEKLSGSDKRARYYDAQMPGLIIDVLPPLQKVSKYIIGSLYDCNENFKELKPMS